MTQSQYAQKVLWHEGMLLLPQHFQQADRHVAANLRRVLEQAQAHAYGFTRLAIDHEALARGQFRLLDAAGLLPDGLAFDIPGDDASPLARPVAIPPAKDRLAVWLGAALERPGEANSSTQGRRDGRATRWRSQAASLPDDAGDAERQDVQLALRHLLLVVEGEPIDGLSLLPLGELARLPSGGLALAPEVVPPVLTLSAAPVLATTLSRLREIVGSRAQELALNRRQRTQGKVEFSVSESANFLMLHSLNTHLPALDHLASRPRVHPETVFIELLRLTGALTTFSSEGHPQGLPIYDHDHPGVCFAALDERLRTLLATSITLRYVPVPLSKTSERIHTARLPEHALEGHRLYLSLQCSLPVERVMKELPIKAKLASSGRLTALIAQAMRGMSLTYLAVPPGEIPAQPNCCYFELAREGEHWQAATDTRSLAIFLPPEFADPKIELMAVKE